MTVQVINSANNNVRVPLQVNGTTYAIVKPINEAQKNAIKKEKEKKSKKLGYKIFTTTIIASLSVFALVKGMPKSARTKVSDFFKFLEEKTAKLTAEEGKLTAIQNFSLKTLKNAKSLIKYLKGIFNIAPLKDNSFKMLVSEKIPVLKKVCDKISDIFEEFSIKTLRKVYSKASRNFEKMCADFTRVQNKIPKENAGIIEAKIQNIIKNFNAFNERAWGQRIIEYKKDMSGIAVQFKDETYGNVKGNKPIEVLKNFFETLKNLSKNFKSEELASPTKIKLADKVRELRERITISPDNNYADIKYLMNQIDDFIDPTDAVSRNLIKKVRNTINDYKKFADSGQNIDKFFKENNISEHLATLKTHISNSGKYDKNAEQVSNYINNLDDILSNGKQGEIQEIMSIYKNSLSAEDYAKLEKIVNKTLKSLDKAINTETDKLFDKIRDILIGSAPLDLLHIIPAVGLVGWGLSKADNNDERISATLKYGIPAIGAVGMVLYCTLGLVSSGPSLIIGALSGLVINRIGEFIDKKRKHYKENPQDLDLKNINLDLLN